jgi:hypothetical protein
VTLTRGFVAIIDAADAAHIGQWNWYALKSGGVSGPWYAARTSTLPDGKKGHWRLHREIAGPPADLVVDHVNGNTMDNRRLNLRVCTRAENSRNCYYHRPGEEPRRAGQRRGKGYSRVPGSSLFMARIRLGGRQIYLGRFSSEEAAANAYQAALSRSAA